VVSVVPTGLRGWVDPLLAQVDLQRKGGEAPSGPPPTLLIAGHHLLRITVTDIALINAVRQRLAHADHAAITSDRANAARRRIRDQTPLGGEMYRRRFS
jgi:hypothetical protein